MSPIIIYSAVFFGVAALVGAIAYFMGSAKEAEVEERLSALTSTKKGRGKADAAQYKELLSSMRDEGIGGMEKFISRYLNLRLLFEQANVAMSVPKLLLICGGLGGVGLILPSAAGFSVMLFVSSVPATLRPSAGSRSGSSGTAFECADAKKDNPERSRAAQRVLK